MMAFMQWTVPFDIKLLMYALRYNLRCTQNNFLIVAVNFAILQIHPVLA